jgi:hypothetical protein
MAKVFFGLCLMLALVTAFFIGKHTHKQGSTASELLNDVIFDVGKLSDVCITCFFKPGRDPGEVLTGLHQLCQIAYDWLHTKLHSWVLETRARITVHKLFTNFITESFPWPACFISQAGSAIYHIGEWLKDPTTQAFLFGVLTASTVTLRCGAFIFRLAWSIIKLAFNRKYWKYICGVILYVGVANSWPFLQECFKKWVEK